MLVGLNTSRPAPELDEDKTAELADMFRLMGDGSRLRIILACLGEPVCVGDIAEQLGLSSSLVSHHLRLLRAARVLRARRQGKQVFYSVADEHICCVLYDMVDHVIEPVDDSEDA
jgi:ArsR family transcriptional regulator